MRVLLTLADEHAQPSHIVSEYCIRGEVQLLCLGDFLSLYSRYAVFPVYFHSHSGTKKLSDYESTAEITLAILAPTPPSV